MRVIGRSQSGQIVGCFERFSSQSCDLLAQRLDAYLRPVEHACLEGFRETVAWLYGIGAVQFECISSVPDENPDPALTLTSADPHEIKHHAHKTS